jgi:hypothetical protein
LGAGHHHLQWRITSYDRGLVLQPANIDHAGVNRMMQVRQPQLSMSICPEWLAMMRQVHWPMIAEIQSHSGSEWCAMGRLASLPATCRTNGAIQHWLPESSIDAAHAVEQVVIDAVRADT